MKILAAKIASIVVSTAIMVVALAGSAVPVTVEKEDDVHISNLHRIDDDLYAWASTVTVDGLVEGDLIAGAYAVKTNGHIRGTANIFAFRCRHTGEIDGGMRVFANECDIDGYVGRSVLAAANEIRVGEKAVIEKEVIIVGNMVNFKGIVKENLKVTAATVILSGTINGNVNIEAQEIRVMAPALIKGDLTYISEEDAEIELDAGVIILGSTDWQLPEDKSGEGEVSGVTAVILGLSKMLAAFLFGVILMSLFKKYALESVTQLHRRPAVSTATGFLFSIIYIISIVVLVISAVLVIIGMTLIYGDSAAAGVPVLSLSILMVPITSFITVAGGVLFYSGKIVMALLVGFLTFRLGRRDAPYMSKLQLLVGLVIVTLIFAIPYAGILVYVVSSIVGGGAIILGIKYCRKEPETTAQLVSGETSGGDQPSRPT